MIHSWQKRLNDNPKGATYLYLVLTLTTSAVVWTLIIWSGHVDMGFGLMIPAIMWCPALAALATCRLLGRSFQTLGWRWPRKRYIVAAYLLPISYTAIAYGPVWAWHLGGWNSDFVGAVAENFGLHGFSVWGSLSLFIFAMATGGMIQSLSMTLGEEIGWRGFLVPELAKQMSFTKLSLLNGCIWAIWHAPLLLFADYNSGTNHWYALGCSSITVVSLGFICAWLRLKSESLWPPAVLHASHNLFLVGVFDNLIRNTGTTLWYTTEFGAAMAITTAMFALYFWTRRNELQFPVGRKRQLQFVPSDTSLDLHEVRSTIREESPSLSHISN